MVIRETEAADNRRDILEHANQRRLACRHAVSTIFRQEDIVSSLRQPVWKGGEIVRHDLAIAMEVHHGWRRRVDCVVRTRQLAAVGGIDPIRVRERLTPWEKVAARHKGMIEYSRGLWHDR